jgi:type IV pilus assembly protein PilO
LEWYFQILVVAGISGALLAGVWYQFLVPIEDEIRQKSGTRDVLQAEIAKSVAKQKDLNKMKVEAAALQAELDLLKRDLPLERETHQILEDIQNLVSDSALKIRNVGPRSTIEQEFYTEWPWDFEIVGTFHNIGMFLDRVRNLGRIVSIGNLKITSRASTGPNSRTESVGATYTATTYVYREEAPVEPPSAKK